MSDHGMNLQGMQVDLPCQWEQVHSPNRPLIRAARMGMVLANVWQQKSGLPISHREIDDVLDNLQSRRVTLDPDELHAHDVSLLRFLFDNSEMPLVEVYVEPVISLEVGERAVLDFGGGGRVTVERRE